MGHASLLQMLGNDSEKSEVSPRVPSGALSEPLSCTSGLWEDEECRWFPLVRALLKDQLGFLQEIFSFFSLGEFT